MKPLTKVLLMLCALVLIAFCAVLLLAVAFSPPDAVSSTAAVILPLIIIISAGIAAVPVVSNFAAFVKAHTTATGK